MSLHELDTQKKLQTTGFHAPVNDQQQDDTEGIDLHEAIGMLFRRWRVMLAAFAIVVTAGALFTFTRRPIYESAATVVVSTGKAGGASDNDIPMLSDLKALTQSRSVDTQVEIISSPDLLENSFNKLSLKTRTEGFGDDKLPKWACKVSSKKNTDVIVITGRAYTREAAAKFANTIVATYFARDLEQNNQATRQARKYVEEKMTTAERDLSQANAELSKFKQQTGLIAPDVQLTKTAEQMAQLTLDLDTAKTEALSGSQAVSTLQKQMQSQQQNVVQSTTITQNPQFNAIVEKINLLNSQRAELLQEYTLQSPEVKKVDACIKDEQARLTSVAETIVGTKTSARNQVRDQLTTKYATDVAALSASSTKARAIESELNELKQAAKSLPETERELTERVRRVALLDKSYEMLSSKYYTLLLSEQAVLPNGMLISQARLPEFSAYPNPKSNGVLFVLLAMMVAVTAAIITERLDCRVHDQSLIERTTGLPTLSVIPEVDGSPELIGNTDSHSALMESYRILRSNIAFSAVGRDLRILAVTSPGPGEGKSTTSVNLAVAMAMEGKKVLLVDCDLRRPAVHKALNISRNIGFTNVVTGTADINNAIVPTEVDGLFCLPSGPIPPNPTEFLSSQNSRDLIERLVGHYDLVILDCPPSTGLSDIQVISTFVDGLLLVVCMDKTLKPHLKITTQTLSQAEAPIMGIVLNRVDTRQQAYGYHYYYYYDYSENSVSSEKHKGKRRRKAA